MAPFSTHTEPGCGGVGTLDHVELTAAFDVGQRRARVGQPVQGVGPNEPEACRKRLDGVGVAGAPGNNEPVPTTMPGAPPARKAPIAGEESTS